MKKPIAYLRHVVSENYSDETFLRLLRKNHSNLTNFDKILLKRRLREFLRDIEVINFPTNTCLIEVRGLESICGGINPHSTEHGYLLSKAYADTREVMRNYVEAFIELLEGKESILGGRIFNPQEPIINYYPIYGS